MKLIGMSRMSSSCFWQRCRRRSRGPSKLGSATAYSTHQPCVGCSKLLISAGVRRIVYDAEYIDPLAQELLGEAGVALVQYSRLHLAAL